MLVAEKQLLDANLRNDLQILRQMEIKMLINRFKTMIPVGTLLCGFTFEGTVEMDLLPPESLEAYGKKRFAVGSFHIWAAITLACSVYAVAVSCVAIVLGQRLAIQATADQTVKHEQNIRELNAKFKGGLFACALALVGVLGSTLCAIWVTSETIYSIIASCIFSLVIPSTSWGCWTLNARLNDRMDEGSTLHLKTSKDAMDVSEFRVGDTSSIPSKEDIDAAMGGAAALKTDGADRPAGVGESLITR